MAGLAPLSPPSPLCRRARARAFARYYVTNLLDVGFGLYLVAGEFPTKHADMLDKHAAWDAAPECGRRVAASKQRTWWTWSRLPAAQPGPFSGDVTSFTGFALAKQPLPGSAFAEAAGGWRYRGQAGDAGVSASIEPLQAFAFCKWALALLGLADSADVSLSEAQVCVSAPSGSRARISKMRARDTPLPPPQAVHAILIAQARLCKCVCMPADHQAKHNGNHAGDGPARLHDPQGRRHSPNNKYICSFCVDGAKLGYKWECPKTNRA